MDDVGNVITDPATYPLFMGYLPSEFGEKLKKDLHETPEIRREKIQQIRRLLRNENDISEKWFNDDTITMYLRGRKYRVQEAFTAIKKMAAFVRKHEYLFRPLDPEVIEKCWKMGYSTFSPVRDKNGCVVINMRICHWNPAEVDFNDHVNYVIQSILLVMSDPMTQVNGIVLLYDFKDSFSLRYAPYLTVSNCKMIYQLFIECMPIRLKAVHGFNPNIFTKIILSVLMTVASTKLKNRIFVHNNTKDVLQYVQANVTPYEYGGKVLPHEMKSDWIRTIFPPDYVLSILRNKKSSE